MVAVNVTDPPYVDGELDVATVNVGVVLLEVRTKLLEVLRA